jgi:hypothetical protein
MKIKLHHVNLCSTNPAVVGWVDPGSEEAGG